MPRNGSQRGKQIVIAVTGDTHGSQRLLDQSLAFLNPGDTLLVAGDFGIGFFDGPGGREEEYFDDLAAREYTILFCDGNHENFDRLNGADVAEWHGGRVHFIRKNLIHLMRGEIYDMEGSRVFVMGGGRSLDRASRVPGESWWPQEMPDEAEYQNATRHLEQQNFEVDFIVSHTAPYDTVEYLSRLGLGITNQVREEYPLLSYLEWVRERTSYRRWYFGHFHLDEALWKNQVVLLDQVRRLETGEEIGMRRHG